MQYIVSINTNTHVGVVARSGSGGGAVVQLSEGRWFDPAWRSVLEQDTELQIV